MSEIVQDGHQVAIVARDVPSPFEAIDAKALINYTSQWGGSHNRWVIPTNEAEERDHAMALRTFRHMKLLSKSNPEATIMSGIGFQNQGVAERAGHINCSGLGFGDKKSLITRRPSGQMCAMANLSPVGDAAECRWIWTFCVLRNFEGGTREPDNRAPEPSKGA
ncbi:hypothetical protein CSUB01_06785 [Colletotrichum sublineola]|uniref:Uncharacterized protein n=1 Tax=Colletotrichum sublineola TaxID=1173701 RepID=A0A066XGL3_COLSU|nr:hypothetical protein CSUB01_06785 [Colletotrichum sublineola]